MAEVDVRVVSPHDHSVRRVYQFAAAHVEGFDARRAQDEEQVRRRSVTQFLPTIPEGGLACSHILAAYAGGHLVGSALIHPTYLEAEELHGQGAPPEMIRNLLASRRTLSGVAVVATHRRQGIGSLLVRAATDRARVEGARWLTGFMDEKNGGPDFYADLGFVVHDRNVPLPQLPPARVREVHPGGVNGVWFYKELRTDDVSE